MYSPRRRYYRYPSKKYYRNQLFAPSLKKAPAPNYYQMKGRIIQQSPLHMKDPQTSVISKDILDQYAKTLQDYHYNIPQPMSPDMSAFTTLVSLQYTLTELFSNSNEFIFNNQWMITAVNNHLNDSLPDPPAGYLWALSCLNIDWYRNGYNSTDSSRYSFIWNSPTFLTDTQFPIIDKDSDTGPYTLNAHAIISCKRTGQPLKAEMTEITYADFTIGSSSVEISTTDANVNDNGWYPLITTDKSASTLNSSLTLTNEQSGNAYQGTLLNFNIIVFLDKQ